MSRGLTLFLAVLAAITVSSEAGCALKGTRQEVGSGHEPLFGPDKRIFNVYHHSPLTIQCTDPFTGDLCQDYTVVGHQLNDALRALDWKRIVGKEGIKFVGSWTQSNFAGPQFVCDDPMIPLAFTFSSPPPSL